MKQLLKMIGIHIHDWSKWSVIKYDVNGIPCQNRTCSGCGMSQFYIP